MTKLEPIVPWEITVINGTVEHPKPLGTREDVAAAFSDSLPGVALQRQTAPPPELLNLMSPEIRESMCQPTLVGDFESDDLSMQLSANDAPILFWVNGEVRGNGDPIPALEALCLSRGWSVIDSCNKSMVDLTSTSGSPGWERFRTWRDKAFSEE